MREAFFGGGYQGKASKQKKQRESRFGFSKKELWGKASRKPKRAAIVELVPSLHQKLSSNPLHAFMGLEGTLLGSGFGRQKAKPPRSTTTLGEVRGIKGRAGGQPELGVPIRNPNCRVRFGFLGLKLDSLCQSLTSWTHLSQKTKKVLAKLG